MLHETVVNGPALQNGYATHQMAHDLLRALGNYSHDDDRVLFDVFPIPGSDREAAWYFRSSHPLESGKELPRPVQGREHALKAHISLSRRGGLPVSPEWVKHHFVTGMARQGIEVDVSSLRVIFELSVKVRKEGLAPFSLRNIHIWAPSVQVTDAEKAMHLLKEGYGRGKAFGFGVVHLREVKRQDG